MASISTFRPLRIVHFIHLDGDGGGPYSVSKHITYYSHFHHVHVIHGGRGRIAETCEAMGIAHSRLETTNIMDALCSLPMLAALLTMLRPDILILHGQWAGPVGGLAGWVARVPRMLYIAQWPSFFTDWDLFRVVRNWLSEYLPCRLCHTLATISPANQKSYLQLFPWLKGKIQCLSNSIDEGEHPSPDEVADVRQSYGFPTDKLNIVSVGRLADQKRVDWLLEAWSRCRDLHPTAVLWIVGDGPERANLEALASRLELGDSCRFLGSQPRGAVFVAASDITVFTSLYESFGNVTLEAMLCGVPIIASRVPGIESTLEHEKQGLLVAPADIEGLASAIRRVAKDRDLRIRMGKAGQERVKTFLTRQVLTRFLALINSMTRSS